MATSDINKNLASLAAKRRKNMQGRSRILDTILEISASRAANAPNGPALRNMSGFRAAAGRAVAKGGAVAGPHSMGDGHNHSSQGAVNGLNSQFKSQLDRLIRDSGGKIKIGSGYRSIAQQAVLYDRYRRGVKGQAPAAKPGRSNHNFGLAADLVYQGGMHGPTGKWARANAAKYGLRFPMSYEPWHIEPLNARAMRGK